MTTFVIKGRTDDGEKVEETFQTPDGPMDDWKQRVFFHAVATLWNARWVPGSLEWRVYTADGIPLPIGEYPNI